MAGRHRSMDQGNTEPRPYCQTCDKWFRKWGRSTTKHEEKGHTVVTRIKKTR
jgi:hypothetical protein